MAIIRTAPRTDATTDEANAAQWRAALAQLAARRAAAAEGGAQRSRERHLSRGKLLARERVARLIDPASIFHQIMLYGIGRFKTSRRVKDAPYGPPSVWGTLRLVVLRRTRGTVAS